MLALHLTEHGLAFDREVRLVPQRRYRWDFVVHGQHPVPERRRLSHLADLVVEVQGGVFIRGGHSTGAGITRDCEKQALALCFGYRQLNVTTAHVFNGNAIKWIQAILTSECLTRVTPPIPLPES